MDHVHLAFLFGGLSALSLPLGAAAGIWLNPGTRLTAAVMAFGAGALLCALALELVVPALEHFPDAPMEGFFWLASGALSGALLFIGLDHAVARMGGYLRKHSTIHHRLRGAKKRHYHRILDRLSVLDLMVSLPADEIRRVVSHIRHRRFAEGDVICQEEAPCDALFLIESGEVRIRVAADGSWRTLGPGEAFGEMALIEGPPAIERAVAATECLLWEIHKDDFNDVVAVSPGLRKNLDRIATRGQHPADIGRRKSAEWLAAARKDLETELGPPTEAEVMDAASREKSGGSNVALAIWLGIALDGIPESLIIGGSMEGAAVSTALVGGLFLANLPESMSSAVVMKKQGTRSAHIIGMWTSLMIMTAVGAAFGHVFIADAPYHARALLEGIAAGAMLAMVAQTMLPEAYDHGGWLTGLMTVVGFLAAIWMGALGA